MAIKRKTRNRLGRVDPSLPKNPPAIPVQFAIGATNVGTFTAFNGDVITYNPVNAETGDLLPGIEVGVGGDIFKATAVAQTAPNVISATFGGVITDGTLIMYPRFASIRSQRGGSIFIGRSTF